MRTWIKGPVSYIFLGFQAAFNKVLHQSSLRNEVDMEERPCNGPRASGSTGCKGWGLMVIFQLGKE